MGGISKHRGDSYLRDAILSNSRRAQERQKSRATLAGSSIIFCDNQNLELLWSKHIDIRHHFKRSSNQTTPRRPRYGSIDQQLADILLKSLSSDRLHDDEKGYRLRQSQLYRR